VPASSNKVVSPFIIARSATDGMEEEPTLCDVSGGCKSVDHSMHADDNDDLALPAINAIDSSRENLTINPELIEDLLREMEMENNFDPFTQVSTVDMVTSINPLECKGN